jgi:hypothetical protein
MIQRLDNPTACALRSNTNTVWVIQVATEECYVKATDVKARLPEDHSSGRLAAEKHLKTAQQQAFE